MPRKLLSVVAIVILFGACGGGGESKSESADAPSSAKVAVKDFKFAPKETTVKTGGTVTWTNEDDFDHSIVVDDLKLASPNFGPQTAPASYEHSFDKAGTYPYYCGVHNSMTGTVVVS